MGFIWTDLIDLEKTFMFNFKNNVFEEYFSQNMQEIITVFQGE